MKLVVNAYTRSGAESTDRTEKRRGSSVPPQQLCLLPAAAFSLRRLRRSFDIPTVDAGGGAVPSFIAAVLPAETDSEIAVLKSTETAGSPTTRLSAYTGMRAVLSCAYC